MKQTLLLLFAFPFLPVLFNPDNSSISMKEVRSQTGEDSLLATLFAQHPDQFPSLSKLHELNVQVLYTQIDRDKKNEPHFTTHAFGIDTNRYFYPASTVKLPVAILALQRLRELNIKGLDRSTIMLTGAAGDGQIPVTSDSSAVNGKPSIGQYIKKILLVSDNDAFNRLYEFLGPAYINQELQKRGYTSAQIVHRLSVSLTPLQQAHTNPVQFVSASGKIIYQQPDRQSPPFAVARPLQTPDPYLQGKGFIRDGQLVQQPFDFWGKNRISLRDLHQLIRAVLFPESIPEEERFLLKKEDYDFLRMYMSMVPGESDWPSYDSSYYPNYVKMLYYGSERTRPEEGIRIFNKTGTAYGYLVETAYFADFRNGIEFILSATIYCNSDGIFNDDRYDYATVGHPFMKQLGRMIYAREVARRKKYAPDLSAFRYQY